MVDPTVELTQPGGPYLYGEVILTDGAGSYTIAPTLRPYFVSFKIPSVVGTRETVDCEHQGVNTAVVGFPVTLSLNLIGIAVALNKPLRVKDVYRIEIVRDLAEVVAVLEISGRERRFHVRNLSESIPAGAELSCRITNEKGSKPSTFSLGLITVELEA
jgi:hypothetical protein